MGIMPAESKFIKENLLGLLKKPILWVLVLFAIFGFVIWEGEETKRKEVSES